jgi:hypothetical protein
VIYKSFGFWIFFREIFKNKGKNMLLMAKKKPKKKGVLIWHGHFGPALTLGIIIIIFCLFFDMLSGAGMVMLASIAASAVMLTHKYRHHLTTLGTISFAYFIAAVFAVGLVPLLRIGRTPLKIQVFIVLFLVISILYWLNLFHPPAISFAMGFMVFEKGIDQYLLLLLFTLALFLVIRIIIYIGYEHLSIKHFVYEIVRQEEKLIKKEERKVRKVIKKV